MTISGRKHNESWQAKRVKWLCLTFSPLFPLISSLLRDFISWTPESAHMITWAMSDRAIPRSYRMMQGFGVHTFALINAEGKRTFVKFHWRPMLGVHGLVWDESMKLGGVDPDYHRRDLYEAISNGDFPEYELGFQCVKEEDEHKFDFDLLDATKIIPEELVPIEYIGKMTLNRLPSDFFAEVEQVAFCTQNIVPGQLSIDMLSSGGWHRDWTADAHIVCLLSVDRFQASTSPMIRCCRGGTSPTSIPS
jgi:hypothetical protein